MLYVFPPGTTATVVAAYDRPYADPITVRAGDPVTPDPERSRATDVLGWTWCTGPDGRTGWVPSAWFEPGPDGLWRATRDFSAIEHTVRPGDRAMIHWAESGFVWATVAGVTAWIPDAVLCLDDGRGAP